MELMRYNPFRNLSTLRERINRLFDLTFPSEWESRGELTLTGWQPTVDIYEKDDKTVVHAELPGVKKEDISIGVRGNVLTLRGQRSVEEEVNEENYYRKEINFGSFQRSFNLLETVKPDQVEADFKDGVLKIEIHKPEETKPRRITIR
jgi:HSP20 family protein